MKEETSETKITKINRLQRLIDGVCGIYSRVARRLGVHRTFVSRVARGERHSTEVQNALVDEYERARKQRNF